MATSCGFESRRPHQYLRGFPLVLVCSISTNGPRSFQQMIYFVLAAVPPLYTRLKAFWHNGVLPRWRACCVLAHSASSAFPTAAFQRKRLPYGAISTGAVTETLWRCTLSVQALNASQFMFCATARPRSTNGSDRLHQRSGSALMAVARIVMATMTPKSHKRDRSIGVNRDNRPI
jgi:hypothetical protein